MASEEFDLGEVFRIGIRDASGSMFAARFAGGGFRNGVLIAFLPTEVLDQSFDPPAVGCASHVAGVGAAREIDVTPSEPSRRCWAYM